MSVLDDAQKLAAAGQPQAAVELVRQAASAGDAEGIFAVANWNLFGLNGPRDFDETHRLLDRAAALGHLESIQLKATLVANGTGCEADPERAATILKRIEAVDDFARVQLSVSQNMRSDDEAMSLPYETLSEDPAVRVVRGLLTNQECAYIKVLAEPRLQRSFIVDPRTHARVPHPMRTSDGMSYGPSLEDLVIHRINCRLAAITGTQVGWGEPLHILRYSPGQEYRPHIDALPAVDNQRLWTVLLYLNEEYEGGATRFDRLRIDFRGRLGDALVFRNLDGEGNPDQRTRHAGLPVTSGAKWLATRWIRESDYHPFTDA